MNTDKTTNKALMAQKLFLVDVENLVGAGLIYEDEVARARQQFMSLVDWTEKDCVFVAANPINRQAVYEGWPGAVYSFQYGQDGADLQIMKFFSGIENISKYSSIVLASGDGGLFPVAKKVKDLGLDLKIVAKPASCSHKYNEFQVVNMEEY